MLLSSDVWSVTIRNISCQDIIEEVTADYIREKMWSATEDMLLCFQAATSGPLLRKEHEARKSFLYEQEEHVTKIQVCESPTTRYRKLSFHENVLFDNRTVNYQHSNKQMWLQILSLTNASESTLLKTLRWEGCWVIFHLWSSGKYSGHCE